MTLFVEDQLKEANNVQPESIEVPHGFKMTELGQIPEDWHAKRFGDIIERILGGGTPSRSNSAYWSIDIPWVTVKDFATFNPYKTQESISQLGLKNSASNLIPKGTVITSTRMGLGKAVIYKIDVSINQDLKAVFVRKNIDNVFLYYWFQRNAKYIENLGGGSTVKGISLQDLKNITFLKPPLIEQQAIVKALSDIDSLIKSLDQLVAKKRYIKLAVMQQLLTGKQRLPGFSEDWKLKRIGDIFEFLSTANNPRSDLSDHGEIGYIHYGDIHGSSSSFFNCSKKSMPYIDQIKVKNLPYLEVGDLVIADASEDYEGIGKSIEILQLNNKKIVAGLHTFLLRGNKSVIADGFKGYLQYMPSFRRDIVRLATGISVYGISKNNLRDIQVKLPTIHEQVAIAKVVYDMDIEISSIEQQLAKARNLKQGMMQELLTGRIRLT